MSDAMPSTPISEASTKFDAEPSLVRASLESAAQARFQRAKAASASTRDILVFLIAFRILNALSIRTFFQPDEFFQSLEPAWQIAFGNDSGAWITWEWKYHLRSSIHPYIFAAAYWLTGGFAETLQLSAATRAELLIAAPKIIQACIAACGDYYTWKLGGKVYGQGSLEAWACLALTVCSPWQWFCSTRTLSNCLETSLTVVALYYWPWQWSFEPPKRDAQTDESSAKASEEELDGPLRLRKCLLLAALACVLRPTNVLIWAFLSYFTLFRVTKHEMLVPSSWSNLPILVTVTWSRLFEATRKERYVLIREAFLCGTAVLLLSTALDWTYYKQLTFPPFKFLYFNIAQSLAVFYGRNDWHYYLSQGYPLLLTTFLPFAGLGLYDALQHPGDTEENIQQGHLSSAIRYQLAAISLLVPTVLSFISHKEVRFIYPLLPLLHVIAAPPAAACLRPALATSLPSPQTSASSSPAASQHVQPRSSQTWTTLKLYRPTILPILLLLNLLIAIFATQHHQRGVLTVMDYLRHEHEVHYLTQPPAQAHLASADTTMTVGFLMPCHSTPWRSHLVYPDIKAWALGCEPPVHIPPGPAREAYVDEADRFYADPVGFMERELGPPRGAGKSSNGLLGGFGHNSPVEGLGLRDATADGGAWDGRLGRKPWPDYLVFFEGATEWVAKVAGPGGYAQCWRGWNSWVHDDSRRRGDVVVWCLRGKRFDHAGPRSRAKVLGKATRIV